MSKKNEIRENELEQEKETQNSIRELEQFYVDGTVENMLANIEKRKEEIVNEMIEYARKNEKDDVVLNPIVVSNKFFKSIVPITSQEPVYNAEKLGIVYDYYCELIAEVNDKIGNFPSSLTLFCRFAGITLNTLRSYKNSTDYSMRIVAEKIYDQIGDENLTMSQIGLVKERSTIFKLKSQNEIVEKAQPNLNINANIVDVDLDRIQERLNKYSQYSNKRSKQQ